MSASPSSPVPSTVSGIYDISDESRIDAIVAYELNFTQMEKLALETVARTARDPLYCFELAMTMMRLRKKVEDRRFQARQPATPGAKAGV